MTERLVGVWFTVEQARALLVKTTLTAKEGFARHAAEERIERELRRLDEEDPTYQEELAGG